MLILKRIDIWSESKCKGFGVGVILVCLRIVGSRVVGKKGVGDSR